MRPFPALLWALFAVAGAILPTRPVLAAGGPDDALNLREACRRVSSGAYLDAWDNLDRTQRLVESTHTRKQALEKSVKAESALLDKLRARQAAADYDLDLARQVDAKTGLVQTLGSQAKEMASVLLKAEADASAAKTAEETLRKSVTTVFDIKRAPRKPRPEKLDYKAACPKYKFLCPLPREHAIRLRDISTAEPCLRYADQSINQ